MFTGLSRYTQAGIFYGIALGLCTLVALLVPGEGALLVAMFTPLTATLIMLFVLTRDGYTKEGRSELGLRWKGLRYWWLALLLPVPVLLFSYIVVWATGLASVVPPASGGDALKLLVNFASGLVIPMLWAIGEEIGWRGYLQPRLMGLGTNRGLMVTGLLHGIWHLPVLLLTPFYHSGGNLLIIVPLFLLTLTAAGVVFGYLRLAADSVWPAALMHNTWNSIWETLAGLTVANSVLATEYLAGESGVLTLFGVVIVAGILMYVWGRKVYVPQAVPASGD